MNRDTPPAFNESGMSYELANREFDDRDQRRPPVLDNAAHAPGKLCEVCGQEITAGQDARLRPDGWWIHEACPIKW